MSGGYLYDMIIHGATNHALRSKGATVHARNPSFWKQEQKEEDFTHYNEKEKIEKEKLHWEENQQGVLHLQDVDKKSAGVPSSCVFYKWTRRA